MPDISTDDINDTARILGVTRRAAPPVGDSNPSYLVMPDDVGETMRQLGLKSGTAKPKEGTTPAARKTIVSPGRMDVQPSGKVEYEPGEVTTPKEQAAGEGRGLRAQIVSGIPIAGPLLGKAEAAARASVATPVPGQAFPSWAERYSDILNQQQRGEKAFAEAHPVESGLAQFGGGMAVPGIGALSGGVGRALTGMSKTLPAAARIWASAFGGAGINVADALARGDNPLPAGEVGLAAGFGGPMIGEGARALTGALLSRTATPSALAGIPHYGIDLLVNRGLGSMTPAEIAAARTQAGPNAFLGDLTPGLRDITKGIGAVQGPGKDVVERAYEQRNVEARGRLESLLDQHIGPNVNIEDFKDFISENQKAAATPLYNQFRATKIHPTDELKALVPRLDKVGAFDEAEFLAGAKGINLNRNFFTGGQKKDWPTAETWDLVKRGLDSKIEQSYAGGNKTRAAALISLKNEMVGEIEKAPGGQIWKQARSEFADRAALLDQIEAGRDTLLGGRSGISKDQLAQELQGLSGPERAARLVGLRSAIAEGMGATRNGDSTIRNKLLAPNNMEKINLMIGDQRGRRLGEGLQQEAFLSERYPDVVPNRHTGASAVARGEAADLFRAPEPMGWELSKPASYPILGRLMPQNVLQDLRVAGRARAAPALADIVTTPQGPRMDDLIQALTSKGRQMGRAERVGSVLDRGIAGLIAGPVASTYRRYLPGE